MLGGAVLSNPVICASDIQSSVTKDEVMALSRMAAGRIVLEIGCGAGRLTVGLASQAQRVHALDSHGGSGMQGNTLSEFINNIKRYRVVDNVVAHIGDEEKTLLTLQRDVFHAVIMHGPRALALITTSDGLLRTFMGSGKCKLFVRALEPEDEKRLDTFATKNQVDNREFFGKFRIVGGANVAVAR